MLSELPEREAEGRIAEIFAEIRQFYATPYVSSIHRHLATLPGVLEWAWETTAPLFRSGLAQETGWAIAREARLAPLDPIPGDVLAVFGVDDLSRGQIAALAEGFERVAPLNLVFGAVLRDALSGVTAPAAQGSVPTPPVAWVPPAPLPEPPAFATPEALGDAGQAVLERFRSGSGATAFVPGLYRMLANWPALLAHFAVVLGPRFQSEEKTRLAARLLADVDAASQGLAAARGRATSPPPDAATADHLVRMIDGYRVTSPEMILFGRLIREAVTARAAGS